MAKDKKKSCFIIMPITTPKPKMSDYGGDVDHFKHVLELLFIPALTKADFEPIPPKAKGDEIIHGRIVKKLETADLVLCDMSTLNANVFFEFGIRTSLNKPACLVKDELTEKVPFDTTIINYHTYQAALNAWDLSTQIEKLAKHIIETTHTSEGGNSLWSYFGLTSPATPATGGGVEEQIALLSKQIEGLRQERAGGRIVTFDELIAQERKEMSESIRVVFENELIAATFNEEERIVHILLRSEPLKESMEWVEGVMLNRGWKCKFAF